jgi:3-hydroxyacyl-[acyl-carrier-protein] dehydratase
MRLRQIDQIVELKSGVEITVQRRLSGRDAFFRDHFPEFPVLPGVLVLEAMFQSCEWLVRESDAFARSMVCLDEVRSLKFSGFVRPGQTLTVTTHCRTLDEQRAALVSRASVGCDTVASGRLVVERFDLADRFPERSDTDAYLRRKKREQYQLLRSRSPHHQPVVPTGFRWLWIDRFTEFVSGQRARALKTVSLTDEPLDLYVPGFPVMPCSLIIEGLAQAGGILVSESREFADSVVLAKVSKAVFHRPAVPGDTMVYAVELEDIQPEGALVRGTSRIGEELHAETELFFACLDDRFGDRRMISPADVLLILRMYGLYDVGRTPDGRRLEVPAWMHDAATCCELPVAAPDAYAAPPA